MLGSEMAKLSGRSMLSSIKGVSPLSMAVTVISALVA
tara:strand:- start:617 stop:727 length:111 start_codon:yes stop_codon:yes gene_type:complete